MPCLIVGTQIDLRDDPSVREKLARQKQSPIQEEDGKRLAHELGAVKYVECSALTQKGLKNVFDEVSIYILFTGYSSADGLLGDRCCAGAACGQEERLEVCCAVKRSASFFVHFFALWRCSSYIR